MVQDTKALRSYINKLKVFEGDKPDIKIFSFPPIHDIVFLELPDLHRACFYTSIKKLKKELENNIKIMKSFSESNEKNQEAGFEVHPAYSSDEGKTVIPFEMKLSEDLKNLNKVIAYASLHYARKKHGKVEEEASEIISNFYSEFGLEYAMAPLEGRPENYKDRNSREIYSLRKVADSENENIRKIAKYLLSNPEKNVDDLLMGEVDIYESAEVSRASGPKEPSPQNTGTRP